MKVKSESEVAQSCPTLRDPMDYSPPGSSIHGIFQARVLEWGAIAFSKNGLEQVNLTQMTIISTAMGKNPLEEMEQPSQSTRVQNADLGYNLKNDRTILICFQGKPFNITVTQVYAPTTNPKEAEAEHFCEDLQDLPELTTRKKRCSFYHRVLECKSRKSRDTWSNTQVWPWSTK